MGLWRCIELLCKIQLKWKCTAGCVLFASKHMLQLGFGVMHDIGKAENAADHAEGRYRLNFQCANCMHYTCENQGCFIPSIQKCGLENMQVMRPRSMRKLLAVLGLTRFLGSIFNDA